MKQIALIVVLCCYLYGQKITGSSKITGSGSIQPTTVVPSFVMTNIAPGSVNIAQGTTSASPPIEAAITSINGFNSPVTMSTSTLSTGVTVSWVANPVTPPANGTSNAFGNLVASGSAQLGSFTGTATGTSGLLTGSSPFTYQIVGSGFPTNTAHVIITVAGLGSVNDATNNITCPPQCSYFPHVAPFTITLTATPVAGQTFSGWSGTGGCTGTGSCTLFPSGGGSVAATATFSPTTGFLANSTVHPIQWPNPVPNIGTALKTGTYTSPTVITDSSYTAFGTPTSSLAPVTRCTDGAFVPGFSNLLMSAGLGGSGAGIESNAGASTNLVHVIANGRGVITMFNPSTGACGDPSTSAHAAITQSQNTVTCTVNCTNYQDFASGSFSLTLGQTWYAAGLNSQNQTRVDPFTFCFTGGSGCSTPCFTGSCSLTFTQGTPIADFSQAVPSVANTPTWTGTHAYTIGQMIHYTLTGGQLFTWAQSTAVKVGDLAVFNGCAYKVFKADGVTASSGTGPTGNAVCGLGTLPADGTVTWKGIGGPATFIYQITIAGTSGGSSPTFVLTCTGCTSGHPDMLSTYLDGTAVWTNVGPTMNVNGTAANSIGWISWAGSDTTDTYYQEATSTNTYGNNIAECNANLGYNCWNGDQGTGQYAMEYNSATNVFHVWNTFTMIVFDANCSGGTGWNCSGGSWGFTTRGALTPPGIGICSFPIHNEKGNNTGDFGVVTQQGRSSACGFGFFIWNPNQTVFGAATNVKAVGFGLNHWAPGTASVAALNQAGYGASTGVYMTLTPFANPTISAASNIIWQPSPCSVTQKVTSPYYDPPACDLSQVIDNHLSMAFNPGGADTSPICGDTYNYATFSPVEFNAWQGEVICVPSFTSWTNPLTPGTQNPWRFTHIFEPGTNDAFNAQFQISQYSQDGKWVFSTTSWNSTLGTTDGSDPTCGGSYPCNNPTCGNASCNGFFRAAFDEYSSVTNCIGGLPWQPGHTYTLGTIIHPIKGTGGGGTIYPPVQLTAVTVGSTFTTNTVNPVWVTGAARGVTYSDGGATGTWTVISTKGNCRSDVVATKLQ